jgi:hypothetical protein
VFAEKRTILANGPGEGNRPGRAVEVDGGYLVTGRWMFASGISHATWLLAVCHVCAPDGSQRLDTNGKPDLRLMLLPKSSATLHDVWHVSGLRGTGSQSFSVSDLFVPAAFSLRASPATRHERGSLYLFSNNGIFGPAFGSVSMGVAHTCLNDLIDFAAGKVPRGMERSIRENTAVQAAVPTAQARRARTCTTRSARCGMRWRENTSCTSSTTLLCGSLRHTRPMRRLRWSTQRTRWRAPTPFSKISHSSAGSETFTRSPSSYRAAARTTNWPVATSSDSSPR